MFGIFKQMKWTHLLSSFLLAIAGLWLCMYPDSSSILICSVIGYALIGAGAFSIIRYFAQKLEVTLYRNDFTVGLLLVITGVGVLMNKAILDELLPFALGMIVTASALHKLEDGIDAARLGYSQSKTYLILAIINIFLGVVIFINPFKTETTFYRFVGGALMFSGVSDMFSALFLSGKIAEFVARDKEEHLPTIKEEPKDPEPEQNDVQQ